MLVKNGFVYVRVQICPVYLMLGPLLFYNLSIKLTLAMFVRHKHLVEQLFPTKPSTCNAIFF